MGKPNKHETNSGILCDPDPLIYFGGTNGYKASWSWWGVWGQGLGLGPVPVPRGTRGGAGEAAAVHSSRTSASTSAELRWSLLASLAEHFPSNGASLKRSHAPWLRYVYISFIIFLCDFLFAQDKGRTRRRRGRRRRRRRRRRPLFVHISPHQHWASLIPPHISCSAFPIKRGISKEIWSLKEQLSNQSKELTVLRGFLLDVLSKALNKKHIGFVD